MLRGKWNVQYAIAISPDRRKAASRVNSPRMRNGLQTISMTAAYQSSDMVGGRPPCGGPGNPNSFCVACSRKINPATMRRMLSIVGVHFSKFIAPYPRLRLSNQVVDEIKRHFQNIVFETIVHRNTRLGEAPSFGKPAIMYDAESKGSLNYMNLVREMLQRNNATIIANSAKEFNLVEDTASKN